MSGEGGAAGAATTAPLFGHPGGGAGGPGDLLTQFGLLKLAIARGDKAETDRRVAELQVSLKEANLSFFGGLTEEWEKGRDQLKKGLGKAPAGGVSPGRHGAVPAQQAAEVEVPIRDAVSQLLGIPERSIIRKPGGTPPGMADVPPQMKDMPPAMAQQMMKYKKQMRAGQPNMPSMGGFGAMAPPGQKPAGPQGPMTEVAGMGAGGPAPPSPGTVVPKPSTPAERKKATAKEKRVEFDMKVDRPGDQPRR